MTRYLIRRILWAMVLLIAVTFVSYVIFFLTPAHPERLFAGHGAAPATIERTRHYFGLDRPWYVQYGKFAYRLLQPWHNDWLGFSFAHRQWVRGGVADAAAGARHRLARRRRRHPLDADSGADRDPLRAAPALRARPRVDDRRALRRLRASRLDRPD